MCQDPITLIVVDRQSIIRYTKSECVQALKALPPTRSRLDANSISSLDNKSIDPYHNPSGGKTCVLAIIPKGERRRVNDAVCDLRKHLESGKIDYALIFFVSERSNLIKVKESINRCIPSPHRSNAVFIDCVERTSFS